MKDAGIVLLLAIALAATATRPAAAKKTDAEAAALFEKALSASDIQAKGSRAFRLHGGLRLYDPQGHHQDGEMLWIWTPVGFERSEIVLPSYQSVVVSDGKHRWTASNYDYTPFLIYQAEQALALPGSLESGSKMELRKPKSGGGGNEQCVSAKDGHNDYQFCFEAATGHLLRQTNGEWDVTYQYSDYAPWGVKSFPRVLRVVRSNGQAFVEIHIDRIDSEANPSLRLFLPAKESREQADRSRCDKIKAAKLIRDVQPIYPESAVYGGVTGMVRLYADIGTDGIPRGLWLLNSPTEVLASSAVEAISQWQYRPATCESGGAPMETTTAITVTFSSQ